MNLPPKPELYDSSSFECHSSIRNPISTSTSSQMDHVYSAFLSEPLLHAKSFLESGNANVVSSISNNNVLAFSSNVDLLDSSQKHLGVYIYVVDLNLPYYPYLVTSLEDIVTIIEWDDKGTKLLIGDDVGNIQVYSMCDFLISQWQLVYSHCFSGDSILAGVWFHKGIKLTINYDKKDLNVLYQEKFNFSKISPSVLQFGNKHADGYLCITSSGIVYAHLFCSDGKIITSSDFLGNYRAKLQKVDISYRKNGQFLVIATNGNSKVPLACHTINVAINLQEKQKLKLTCQPFTSFALNSNSHSPISYQSITYLKFIVKEAPDAVIVAASGNAGSVIELWELCEKPVTFHSVIHNLMQQQNQKIDVTPNILAWKFSSSTTSSSHVSAIATPRSCLFDTSTTLSYIIVGFQDNTVKCFYRENLQMLVSLNLVSALAQNKTNGSVANSMAPTFGQSLNFSNNRKLPTISARLSVIKDIQLTWSTCAMVAIDSCSQMHVFRLSPITEPCAPMNLNYAQLMLEYSLLSGNDYWDILISIKPSFVETLCDRITDSFINRQNQSMQQKWSDNVLQLKSALYRCVNNGQSMNNMSKSGDFFTIKMLNAISETVKRLIRAREYLENEGPAEKLSVLIQNKPTDVQLLNVDKILLKLDNKDFCVEAITQQSFKYLLQWVCDLSLYLLASIPQQYHQNQYRIPGVGLLFDPKSLNTLRELLVIIRFWGLMNSTCLPVILKMQDGCDVIALIFRLLSKIVASPTDKFDESLVDECCLLPNQVLIPQMDLCPKSIGIAGPALYTNTLPLIFDYGTEPAFMKYNVKVHTIDGVIHCYGNRQMDIVRYIALGTISDTSNNIRSCTRCSSVSLRKTPIRFPASRAWEQQWSKKCFCGGMWRIHKSKTETN